MERTRIVSSEPVTIAASREAVWAILTDLPNYHLWNPLSARIESSLDLGSRVKLWVNNAGITGKVEVFEHRLVEKLPPEHLAWAYEKGDVRTRRDQYLAPADGGCIYTTTDTFYGPQADPMMDQMGEAISQSFNALAAALKVFAESGDGPATGIAPIV
ncbi:hypothetical protein MB02_11755 [Croceicoccus estronivorus]|uniref:SRPBCC domain-containing protein n=1 Tax=Croceicoccus estronivorus TaxID=1172626 RepID=UPI00082A3C87|nr:SRPBCC domain-containing protein [Croceicoccus estronivorus]OCC23306.1 hypothetical protein MB02_11755 [Croceicoccus estronivorus]